ncbi:hypothetical protein [Acanthamoeba polyphaga mimivirus]|uniref:Uncharacterized protein n=1 Tax=Acanthamoeba polyphaga mimivirus TaxID=212035 RepID=A0A0G2Y5J7_MIMIV|nr:hypothetical protein [Acanthamoeba polyphaga mimivirus]
MYQPNFSTICNHNRLKRIDDNFVRCLDCGLSLINQVKILPNKSRQDFSKENKSFLRNFDRNFSNLIEQVDEESSVPTYKYYADRKWLNLIKINNIVQFQTNPPKYEVFINGEKSYLTQKQIDRIIQTLGVIHIDEDQYNYIARSMRKN